MHIRNKIFLLGTLTAFIISACAGQGSRVIGSGKLIVPSYSVTAPATGKIIGLIVEAQERISKDQPLFAIADEKYSSTKELAEQLAKAEAELRRMEQSTADVTPAANLNLAQEDYNAARQKADKMQRLFEAGAISRRQAQAAQDELAQANAQLAAARQFSASLQPATLQSINAQKAAVAKLREQYNTAQSALLANEAVSPCTGTITAVHAQNNASVQQGEPVLDLQASDSCTINFTVSSTQAQQLQVNQPVRIKADGSSAAFSGSIAKISGTSVTAVSEKKPENLQGGVNAEISLAE